MPVRQLGYLRWQSSAFEAWKSFAPEVLGFMPTDGPDSSAQYFRIDDRPYRFVVSEGSENAINALGLEVADDQDLAETVATVEAAGFKVTPGTEDESAQRLVSGFSHFEDPGGIRIELFYGPILDHVPTVTPKVSGFVTGDMGMGHVVIGTADLDGSRELYRNVLGFHRRNTMRIPMPGADGTMSHLELDFYGCNPRHHTLGLMSMPVPGNLVHFMVQTETIDDVGYALDRFHDAGLPVLQSLGRHTNDHMLSFYAATPDGCMVEYGCQGIRVEDPSTETTYEITKPSFWGHRPPAG